MIYICFNGSTQVIVHKPASWPVHASGRFRHMTVLHRLGVEHPHLADTRSCHRCVGFFVYIKTTETSINKHRLC
jgi:23S rRNA-/tRNA-specific pseudouridylate synthase